MTNASETLKQLIKDHAIVRGMVTLSSGKAADYYVDLRRTTLGADSAPLVGQVMLELTKDIEFSAVGGLTMGADPVATAMLHAAAAQGRKLDAFVVRKEAKDHGLQKQVEGPNVAGRKVIVVEDTSTTGNSPLTAVRGVEEAGGEVVAVAVIVDRDSGAKEVVEDAGYRYLYAYSAKELGL